MNLTLTQLKEAVDKAVAAESSPSTIEVRVHTWDMGERGALRANGRSAVRAEMVRNAGTAFVLQIN